MSANMRLAPIALGYFADRNALGHTTLALNAAASGGFSQNWLDFGFNLDQAKTLNEVRVRCSAVTGTLGATDLVCDIYSDSSGNPNASLASSSTVAATPTGAAFIDFTGFSLALSANTQYHVVLRNANATPTSNYPTYLFGNSASSLPYDTGGIGAGWGWFKQHSTNGGSTWVTTNLAGENLRLKFSDSTYQGGIYSSIGITSSRAFGANEHGIKFTSPSNATLNVRGVAMQLSFVGTATGNAEVKLYTGNASPSLQGTTGSIPRANLAATAWHSFFFSSPIAIAGGTVVRVTLADTATDSAAASYDAGYETTWDPDSNSVALLPFEGTWQKTEFDGTTWTDTAGSVLQCLLLLDTNGEFASTGGSGGMVLSRVFTGF